MRKSALYPFYKIYQESSSKEFENSKEEGHETANLAFGLYFKSDKADASRYEVDAPLDLKN